MNFIMNKLCKFISKAISNPMGLAPSDSPAAQSLLGFRIIL